MTYEQMMHVLTTLGGQTLGQQNGSPTGFSSAQQYAPVNGGMAPGQLPITGQVQGTSGGGGAMPQNQTGIAGNWSHVGAPQNQPAITGAPQQVGAPQNQPAITGAPQQVGAPMQPQMPQGRAPQNRPAITSAPQGGQPYVSPMRSRMGMPENQPGITGAPMQVGAPMQPQMRGGGFLGPSTAPQQPMRYGPPQPKPMPRLYDPNNGRTPMGREKKGNMPSAMGMQAQAPQLTTRPQSTRGVGRSGFGGMSRMFGGR